MPHRRTVGPNTHLEQGFDNFEQTRHHLGCGEVGLDVLFAEVVTCFLELFTNEGPIPRLGVGDVQRCARKVTHFSQIFFGVGLGSLGQIAQEIHDLLGRLGHFAGQRYLGVVGIAQQRSFFLAQLQNFLQQWAVIELGMGKLCRGAGGVGAVKLFTQMAAVRVLHDRQIARHLECELVAGMTVCSCCRLGGLQYISGNTLHFF